MVKAIKPLKKNKEFINILIEFYDQIDQLGYKDKPNYSQLIETLKNC